MESWSTTTTATNSSHPLPHQQFSSRIAFANNSKTNSDKTITKVKLNSLSRKSTRLPPLSRLDSIYSPPVTQESLKYFNRSADSCSSSDDFESNNGLDLNLRVKQLEQNLKFVKDDCQQILQALHQELDDLKIKNRDLQFQLITSGSLSPKLRQTLNKDQFVIMPLIRGTLEPQMGEYITKLENEVKRLRTALAESHKINALLKHELHKHNDWRQSIDDSNNNPVTSPTIGDFDKTLEVINKSLTPIESTNNLPRIANTVSKFN